MTLEQEISEIGERNYRAAQLEVKKHFSMEAGCDAWLELRKLYEGFTSKDIPRLIEIVRTERADRNAFADF